jgi:hypothetical protein
MFLKNRNSSTTTISGLPVSCGFHDMCMRSSVDLLLFDGFYGFDAHGFFGFWWFN